MADKKEDRSIIRLVVAILLILLAVYYIFLNISYSEDDTLEIINETEEEILIEEVEENYCGDNIIDSELGEYCDGLNNSGFSCNDFGYNNGEVRCCENCTGFDLSKCYDVEYSCYDADSGADYFITSEVLYEGLLTTGPSCSGGIGKNESSEIYIDRCENNNLLEGICNPDGSFDILNFSCTFGCAYGSCLPEPLPAIEIIFPKEGQLIGADVPVRIKVLNYDLGLYENHVQIQTNLPGYKGKVIQFYPSDEVVLVNGALDAEIKIVEGLLVFENVNDGNYYFISKLATQENETLNQFRSVFEVNFSVDKTLIYSEIENYPITEENNYRSGINGDGRKRIFEYKGENSVSENSEDEVNDPIPIIDKIVEIIKKNSPTEKPVYWGAGLILIIFALWVYKMYKKMDRLSRERDAAIHKLILELNETKKK